jgi:ParB family chromosome partitioning protein
VHAPIGHWQRRFGMPRAKNFMSRDAAPTSAGEADFALLLEAHLGPRPAIAQNVPIDRIRPNPFQARRNFEGLDELAQTIRVQGFTTRLRVRRDPEQAGYFQLAFGERRLRAAQLAGLADVPCDIGDHSDDELVEIGLAENIQRRDLDPLEEARAFRTFVDVRGYTNRTLAERIGKDKSYIEERLALLRTPLDVQHMIEERPDTIRVAREIAKLPTQAKRRPLIEGVVNGTMSSRDIRTIVRQQVPDSDDDNQPQPAEVTPTPVTAQSRAPGAELSRALERDVSTLHTVFARWRQALPHLSEEQRSIILMYIEEHLAELEHLTEALRSASKKQ